jgi:hypothetical protein
MALDPLMIPAATGRAAQGPAGARVRPGPAVDAGPGQDAHRKLFHVGYTIEGTSKLMRRHGWSAQVPLSLGQSLAAGMSAAEISMARYTCRFFGK